MCVSTHQPSLASNLAVVLCYSSYPLAGVLPQNPSQSFFEQALNLPFPQLETFILAAACLCEGPKKKIFKLILHGEQQLIQITWKPFLS